MLRKKYILLLAMFGFFMITNIAFACHSEPQKESCQKELSTTFQKTACCEKDKNTKDKKHQGCSGACKTILCNHSYISIGFPVVSYSSLNPDALIVSSKKQNYYYSETFLSSDFRSIWLPPKIS
jgi:hypothetical protein